MEKLTLSFFHANYYYSILSMVLNHSDAAFLGMSKMVHTLAEDKIKLADVCMNYMTTRNANFNFNLLVNKNEAHMDILDYKMNAAKAMYFLYETERDLAKNVTDVLKDMDIHAQHFLQHTVMEAQYDRLSRIENLYKKIKKDSQNAVYSYEFDRSVNFLYHRLYTNPVDVFLQI